MTCNEKKTFPKKKKKKNCKSFPKYLFHDFCCYFYTFNTVGCRNHFAMEPSKAYFAKPPSFLQFLIIFEIVNDAGTLQCQKNQF